MGRPPRQEKQKYEQVYESFDFKNRVILYLLSDRKMKLDEICNLKVSDVNMEGIQDIRLSSRDQVALAHYLKGSKNISSIDGALFPGRGGVPLTPKKLVLSLSKLFKKSGVAPSEIGVDLSLKTEKKSEIDEDNVSMEFILGIIQEKTQQ